MLFDGGRLADEVDGDVGGDFLGQVDLVEVNVQDGGGNWIDVVVGDKDGDGFGAGDFQINKAGFAGLAKNFEVVFCVYLDGLRGDVVAE